MKLGADLRNGTVVFGEVAAPEEFVEYMVRSIFGSAQFAMTAPLVQALCLAGVKSEPLDIAFAIENYLSDRIRMDSDNGDTSSNDDALSRVKLFIADARVSSNVLEPRSSSPANSRWAPSSTGRALTDELPFVRRTPIINSNTPIGAAGSCFATEITQYLQSKNYNYVVTEPNDNSCAAWGGLYNTPSFRQLVEVAFGLRKRPNLLFECADRGQKEFWDPFREGVFFDSIKAYESGTSSHLAAARKALTKTKVFIMTVGLNEIWRLSCDGSVLARYPRALASHLVSKQILTVQENVNELQRMLDIWRTYNPDLKIIITVSPVPLYATFRAEESHVINSTCHSKSVLRTAVEQFVRQNPSNVFYFPAFEVVSYCAPEPWTEDCRHVTRDTVKRVMELFENTFLER